MPSQVLSSVENNFTKGLITEFTGLNFPENAATDTSNCEYSIVGDVTRRLGINVEVNGGLVVGNNNQGRNTYVWNNAGGDGSTKVLVRQDGITLRFYLISAVSLLAPVSQQILFDTVNIVDFAALQQGGALDISLECQFSDGNGYLFVYHPGCDPFYCTYENQAILANLIPVQIRDFQGIPEPGLGVTTRPAGLGPFHEYNLINQGWSLGNAWSATSASPIVFGTGSRAFTVASGLTITNGDSVGIITTDPTLSPDIPAGAYVFTGTVTGYSGTTLTINIATIFENGFNLNGLTFAGWNIYQLNQGHIQAWSGAIGNYPSNSDVWWYYKDNTGVFNPATTISNVTLNSGNAPKGHYVLSAFNQQRSLVSGIPNLTDVSTSVRPRTGTWFQGRVWFAGLDDTQAAIFEEPFYTWTENIYFSQIVTGTSDFGHCYQLNDPTSEDLFDLLPTDGGVITIQGSGSIYKLFPIQNGMLVFAANGIWFITGSQGIGFTANDYTITKISNIQNISSTSFVNVQGLPYFWNEEGIYSVSPAQQGGLTVEPLTVGTILSFYNDIPTVSKKYVRGDYHPIDYVIQWTYRSSPETSIVDRYNFDTILNFNTYNKAFFPYTVSASTGVATPNAFIAGVNYISYPQASASTPDPGFKYPMSYSTAGILALSIAEEYDTQYVDWFNLGGANYDSYFVTGYKLHGQGQRRFQIPYIYMYSRSDEPTSYKIQGLWDYAISGDSGRWSTNQLVNNWSPNFSVIFRRHKIRGRGLVLQLKVSSVDGQPFDIIGWSTFETQNTGI